MRRRTVCLGLLLSGVLPLATATRAAAEGLPGEFAAGYRSALEAMKKAYSQATIEGTVRTQYPQTGKSIDRSFVFRVAGPWSRIDATTTAQKGMGATVGGTQYYLATPDASLQGYQRRNSKRSNVLQEDTYETAQSRIGGLCPISFPYSMGTQGTILDMLQGGGVKITSVKTGKRDAERMVQFTYVQQVDPEGRQGPWNGTMLISIDQGYALRDYSRTAGHGDRQITVRGSLTYDMDRNGVPLLSGYDRREEHGNAKSLVERQTVSISKFDTEAPQNIFFTADGF